MSLIFRDMALCECGKPRLAGQPSCRTCYEDGLRRQWRDEQHDTPEGSIYEGIRSVFERREMMIWEHDTDCELCCQMLLSTFDPPIHPNRLIHDFLTSEFEDGECDDDVYY